MTILAYEVGGCVRDNMLGVRTNDYDFGVEAPSFGAMREWLVGDGFKVFLETEDTFTIRARFPRGHKHERMTADFVLCRKDGPSSDGRHPDYVEAGTIWDDLARRDFTVNAMAVHPLTDELLDPFNGRADLATMTLRFVGDPWARLTEDALRALRAVRFAVTKGFSLHDATAAALGDERLVAMLESRKADGNFVISTQRVWEELHKAFKTDTIASIRLLDRFGLLDVLMARKALWLEPTLRIGKGPR